MPAIAIRRILPRCAFLRIGPRSPEVDRSQVLLFAFGNVHAALPLCISSLPFQCWQNHGLPGGGSIAVVDPEPVMGTAASGESISEYVVFYGSLLNENSS